MIFTKILDRVERSARNSERLHLEIEQVRALISSPIYTLLSQLHAEELTKVWQKPSNENSSSATNGLSIVQSEMTGASAGIDPRLVHEAESRRVLAAVIATIPRSLRRQRLPRPLLTEAA